MGRVSKNFPIRKITDEHIMDVFAGVANRLSGLLIQEYDEGRVLVFTDDERHVRHVVCNIDRNNWACFNCEAEDGECEATTYARASNIKAAS